MVLAIEKSAEAVYFLYSDPNKHSEFWIRQSARKHQLDPKDIFSYIKNHF